jgi:hypothetical protein
MLATNERLEMDEKEAIRMHIAQYEALMKDFKSRDAFQSGVERRDYFRLALGVIEVSAVVVIAISLLGG